jgi:hypothetical protein
MACPAASRKRKTRCAPNRARIDRRTFTRARTDDVLVY